MADDKNKDPEQAPQGALLLPQHQRPSYELIYEAMMRAGGEPFGAPYDIGLASLTDRIVAKLRQRSFFGFETLEKKPPRGRGNKFTKQGAAPYRGPYRRKSRP